MHQNLFKIALLSSLCAVATGCDRLDESAVSQPAEPETTTVRAMPSSLKRPAYLQPALDPDVGKTVVRVSDRAAFGSQLSELRHLYAKNQPWNADESYLLLNYKYPGALLDGQTYKFIRWVRQPSQSVWSNLNPNLMYGTISDTNKFVKLDISNRSDRYTVMRTFSEYDKIDFGAWEGNLSNNDRYAALAGIKGNNLDLLVYDLQANRVVAKKPQPVGSSIGNSGKESIDNITMSQSGKYVIVQYSKAGKGANRGIHLFDRSSLKPIRQLSTRGGTHFDSCVDAKGAETMVVADDASSAIVSLRYTDGRKTTLLSASKSNHNIHISCRNLKRPGWAYVSEFAGEVDPNVPAKTTPNRTFALKIDGSGKFEQFVPPHHSQSQAYERQPHSVPNRNGQKVIFASDWGNAEDPVYSYVSQPRFRR